MIKNWSLIDWQIEFFVFEISFKETYFLGGALVIRGSKNLAADSARTRRLYQRRNMQNLKTLWRW